MKTTECDLLYFERLTPRRVANRRNIVRSKLISGLPGEAKPSCEWPASISTTALMAATSTPSRWATSSKSSSVSLMIVSERRFSHSANTWERLSGLEFNEDSSFLEKSTAEKRAASMSRAKRLYIKIYFSKTIPLCTARCGGDNYLRSDDFTQGFMQSPYLSLHWLGITPDNKTPYRRWGLISMLFFDRFFLWKPGAGDGIISGISVWSGVCFSNNPCHICMRADVTREYLSCFIS